MAHGAMDSLGAFTSARKKSWRRPAVLAHAALGKEVVHRQGVHLRPGTTAMADVTPLNAIMRRHRAIEIGNGEKNHDPGCSKLISSVTDLMSELLAVSLLKVSPLRISASAVAR